ncbi:class II fructose-1,6-bisphosphate aldolase [Neobacillus cucumis]|uniref:class II fructose-1,6-bisphosphate aldolase n=1 Tax=Neobacillus cucumis TaxID=1740721 RepID=UPI00203C797E|nr:class II fructose-1,6-bisphosphate aldolase [Neobacillus cucumis]MCM3729801.1 class II fructose-1,6-bisphosphate aldolase [Neobacillus cucumis]
MTLVSMSEMLGKAKKEKYAVPQFNIINMEFTQAIVEVSNEENSPVILGVGEPTIKYMGMEYVIAIANAAAKNSSIPITLHLDHGSSFEVVMQCIKAGFSSVMIDGSKYSFEKNIALTNKVVEAAHSVGVSVEAELGTIGGAEDNIFVNENDVILPSAEEAIEFWNHTNVDALAVAVGTAHGMYKIEPKIKFDVISKISNSIPVPLVLHGGSGVPEQDIQKAINCGISKINVNTENQVAFSNAVRQIINNNDDIQDSRLFLRVGRDAVKEMVRSKIRLFSSANKTDAIILNK